MYIIFFLMWVILNGRLTIEIAIFGLVIAAAMYAFICHFMDFSMKKDLRVAKKTGLILKYGVVLLWEILKSNLVVSRMVLKKGDTNPVLIHFKTDLKSKTLRVVLANSITLTPGTITVSLEDNEYTVHCLDKSLAEGIEDSVFVHMLHKLEA